MNKFIKLLSFIFFVVSANSIFPQDSGFILTTGKTQVYYPCYIGNGHFSISSSQLGTKSTESYLVKFYDEGKNDIPRIAALPEWNEINYFDGNKWLNDLDINSGEISNYSQELDMLNGLLHTSYTWNDSPNRQTDIDIVCFISRSNKNLAVIKYEFKPDFTGEVKLNFSLKEREKPERIDLAKLDKINFPNPNEWPYFWYPGFTKITKIGAEKTNYGANLWALTESSGRNTKAGIASEIFYGNKELNPEISVFNQSNAAYAEFNIKSLAGKKYVFYKIVSVAPEFEFEDGLVNKAIKILNKSRKSGFEKLFLDHKAEWNKLWNTDIIVEGNNELQRIIHSMMFYLLCSIDKNTDFGMPPMGLSTSGYFGHIFWDSDIYMIPPLLLMHPQIAKSIIKFRYNTLPGAIENAKINGYKGAMYPWESDEIGKEATPYFAYQNAIKENHIVGDVAFAQWQYFLATNDTAYLRNYGADIIRQTADFWVSRVVYNKEKDRYEIHKLISVAESDKDVNNETYTNAVAKINLELAIKVSKLLSLTEDPEWEKINKKMFIPFNAEKEFHPLYENAGAGEGASRFWSSVVNLLDYPLQIKMSENTKRNDLGHAVKSLEVNGAGAMMGSNFLAIIAAELGNDFLMNLTINKTLKGYLKPPFNALSEAQSNNSVNFLTGAGSFLQQVIFGYTGLRITDDGLMARYKPMLPHGITKLKLQNFKFRNKTYDFIVQNGQLTKIEK
ncbi:MAG TPA: hypothetical protein VKA26_03730 [Ignavibacteriaceae bacterium]|nr:hypothetical protein [Ignavibacteriaceae bacterium]